MFAPFWITGLPRSRTAWFAEAMRGARSSCFHELTAETRSFAEFKARWLSGADQQHRGNSDSGCGLHIARIMDEIAPRTLIVERPIDEVERSLKALLGVDPPRRDLERLQEALAYSHPLIKRVRFSDLADRHALVEAVEWLLPGHGEAAGRLADVNIQVTRDYAAHLARTPHTLWHMQEAP